MQATHRRKGNVIIHIESNKQTVYESINEAKRESVRIQLSAGGLGKGAVTLK